MKFQKKIVCIIGTEWREIEIPSGRVIRFLNSKSEDYYLGSESWRVLGAVILNNFGQVTKRLSLQELYVQLNDGQAKSKLFHKNGKAKFRITDIDHGTYRQWGDIFQSHRILAMG
jgi:hypothetical protein